MFRTLHDHTVQTLHAAFAARPLPVPEAYACKEGTLRDTPLTMTNIAFETDKLRKIRLTYIDAGDAAQILTTMVFPRPEYDLPIFGADVLAFKGAPHLIVIDHQLLYKDDPDYCQRYAEPMAAMYQRYAHFPARGRTLPAWTEEFFSPYTHYSRPPLEHLPEVLAAYREYWDSYLERVAVAQPVLSESVPEIYARQAAYCRNHIENEQAEGMLQRLFGVAWCEGFIHDFLFDVHEVKQ